MSAFDNSHWTIDQVIAWVSLKNRALVEQVIDHKGRASVAKLAETAEANGKLSCDQAKNAVLEALETGHLRAWGVRNNNGDHELIPAKNWLGMDLFFGRSDCEFDAGQKDPDRSGTRWYRLMFERDETKRIYEATAGAIASTLGAVTAALGGNVSPTGTMASTLGAVTAALSGTVVNGPPVANLNAVTVALADDVASAAQINVPRRGRKLTPDQDRRVRDNIERVLSEANKLVEAQGKKSIRDLARLLANPDMTRIPRPESLPFKDDTIRDILSGRYGPMLRRNIESPFATGSGDWRTGVRKPGGVRTPQKQGGVRK